MKYELYKLDEIKTRIALQDQFPLWDHLKIKQIWDAVIQKSVMIFIDKDEYLKICKPDLVLPIANILNPQYDLDDQWSIDFETIWKIINQMDEFKPLKILTGFFNILFMFGYLQLGRFDRKIFDIHLPFIVFLYYLYVFKIGTKNAINIRTLHWKFPKKRFLYILKNIIRWKTDNGKIN